VRVSARVAAWLLRYAGLDQYRREHRGEDPEVDNTLVQLTVIAYEWRSSATGTRDAPKAELDPQFTWMSTTQAAQQIGLTPRGIVKAITENRLKAERVGRTWRINPEQLAYYQQGRQHHGI